MAQGKPRVDILRLYSEAFVAHRTALMTVERLRTELDTWRAQQKQRDANPKSFDKEKLLKTKERTRPSNLACPTRAAACLVMQPQ